MGNQNWVTDSSKIKSFSSFVRPIAVRRRRAEREECCCIQFFRYGHSSPETAAEWRSFGDEEEISGGGESPFTDISSIYDDVPMAEIRPLWPGDVAGEAEPGRAGFKHFSLGGEDRWSQ